MGKGLSGGKWSMSEILQKYYSKTEKQSLIYNLARILDPSKKLTLYADWGSLTVQDPTLKGRNTNSIAYSDYYQYVHIPLPMP